MPKPAVFVTGHIADSAINMLKEHFHVEHRNEQTAIERDELLRRVQQANALVTYLEDRIDSALMDQAPHLQAIANVAVGFDNIDIKEATSRGIIATNTPGVLTNATADLAFSLLLAVSRRIAESDRYVRAGRWKSWSADLMLGVEVAEKTLRIVGMGRIGEAVAKRARAFGMNIVYTRRAGQENDARLLAEYGARRVTLDQLLSSSDFISLHSPLTPQTKHMIGAKEFAMMKPSCILINTARGAVVDQPSMVKALVDRKIAGAGLDVFDGEPEVPAELIALENVVLTPHIGSATYETRQRMAEMAAAGLIQIFQGHLPDNAINKEAWETASAKKR